jgi:hypothetical protein
MRHPRAQQCVIIAAYLAVCAAAKADGWATNAWPSQRYPRQGKTQLSDVWSSTVERCKAAGVSEPSAPVWYRSERTTLANCKASLKASVANFVDMSALSSGTPAASNYFIANQTLNVDFPKLTLTGLLYAVQLPTNYFDYTPRRSLTGLGGSTNDASVGLPHGETNATTAAGGGNYPAGRSAWYTTDYGWSSWTSLVSRLLCTSTKGSWQRTNTYCNYLHYPEAYGATEAAMQANVDASYGLRSASSYQMEGTKVWYYDYRDGYAGWKGRTQRRSSISGLSTSLVKQVEYYAWTSKFPTNVADSTVESTVYDTLGLPLIEDTFAYVGSSSPTNEGTVVFVWGPDSPPRPDWISVPVGTFSIKASGFVTFHYPIDIAYNMRGLIRWDVLGGFVYR